MQTVPALESSQGAATAEALKPRPGAVRYLSLDAYRGMIMILLVSVGFGFGALDNHPILGFIARQFDHVAWEGTVFWDLVQPHHDDLKWCGSSPLYTFMRAVPQARGELLRYQQWNIDPQSVVSFAGMAFRRQD